MKQQHFVTFFSPGTFVAEMTEKPIDSWDVEQAKKMAHSVKERYEATPYGFRFTTRARKDDELDSKEIAKSPMYFLGGKIETLADVKKRNDAKEAILRSNMECNGWERIVVNTNSWKWVQPMEAGDVVLEFAPQLPHDPQPAQESSSPKPLTSK